MRFLSLAMVAIAVAALMLLTTTFAATDPTFQRRTPAGDVQATIQARQTEADTVNSAQGSIRQTAQAAQSDFEATTGAIEANIQATAQAAQGNAQTTVTASVADIGATVQARQVSIQMTAQAAATSASIGIEQVEATVQALTVQLPEQVQDLTLAELEDLLTYIGANGSLSVDMETQTVNAVYSLPEATVNAYLDAAMIEAGVDPSALSVNFIPEGAFITMEEVTLDNGLSGRLTILLGFEVVDGRVVTVILYAALNDTPLPENVLTALNAELQNVVDSALTSEYAYTYTVESVYTDDTSLTVSAIIPFAIPN
jgi:hypothetical protein